MEMERNKMKPFIYERQLDNNSEVEMLHLWDRI